MEKLNEYIRNINKYLSRYYRRYFKDYPYSYIEDDLMSEIMLGIYEAFKVKDKYSCDFDKLVNTILKRKAIYLWRKKTKEKKRKKNIEWDFDIPVENYFEKTIEVEDFVRSLDKVLNEKEKELLEKLLKKKKLKEIAEELGISLTWLDVLLKRLREKVKEEWCLC